MCPYADPERQRAAVREAVRRNGARKRGELVPNTPLIPHISKPILGIGISLAEFRRQVLDRNYLLLDRASEALVQQMEEGKLSPLRAHEAGLEVVRILDMSLKQPPTVVVERTINRELLVIVDAAALRRLEEFSDGLPDDRG